MKTKCIGDGLHWWRHVVHAPFLLGSIGISSTMNSNEQSKCRQINQIVVFEAFVLVIFQLNIWKIYTEHGSVKLQQLSLNYIYP